ncbi:MAG: DUF3090 family protein [Acidobacteria bacterium]|nr:DUF3090 family protein [Acidobacteriota bacterium]
MSASFDLGPVDRITAGAAGEPGQRVVYVQARAGERLVTLLAEKEQVHAFGTVVRQLVESLPARADESPEPPESELDLEEPAVADWRAGSVTLSHDEESDRIGIVIEEALPDESVESPATARLEVTRAQARAFAERALAVAASGRPRCPVCGFPMDPGGHACPAMNGHRGIGR